MKIFYFMTISTFLLAVIAIMNKDENKKANLIIAIIIMCIFTLVSGLRNGMGDTGAYIYSYNLIGPGYDFETSDYEPGFLLILILLKSISADPQFMIFTISLIVNVINIYVIRKYSENFFELSVFMYMVSYYIVTMNGVRQSLAASLIFLATPLIIERKFKIYCLVIVLISTIHASALVMIPLYFVCIRTAWSREIWNAILFFLVAMVFYEPFMEIVYKLLGDSKYAGYQNFNEGGANIIRILVYFVPVFLSYIKRDYLKEWKYGNVFINMTLLNFIIMAFAYYNWIFARFTIYTQLYVLISLPFIVKNCFKDKSERRLVYYGFIICYLIFFMYDSRVSNINYTSNFSLNEFFYEIIEY